jgi:two-component system CheB/CheR fusion protein
MTTKKPPSDKPDAQPASTAGADAEKAPTGKPLVDGFPIIGVGASAGGLAAFEAFFSGMPKDTELGMAVVLVQHLAPDHKSILPELIRRYTHMPVFEVEDGMQVHINTVYILPPQPRHGLHGWYAATAQPHRATGTAIAD